MRIIFERGPVFHHRNQDISIQVKLRWTLHKVPESAWVILDETEHEVTRFKLKEEARDWIATQLAIYPLAECIREGEA